MYAEQTFMKLEVITMSILLKDEKKYSEWVDVLDQLEKWPHNVSSTPFNAAFSDTPPPAIGNYSRPDQPPPHFFPTTSTNDQLTRVRLAGAKDLPSACHTATHCVEHSYSFLNVDWQTNKSFLKVLNNI